MKSTIEDIFLCNHISSDNIKYDEEYKKYLKQYTSLSAKFEETLTKEQREIFEKLCDLESYENAQAVKCHYVEGFKLGLSLALECFYKEN